MAEFRPRQVLPGIPLVSHKPHVFGEHVTERRVFFPCRYFVTITGDESERIETMSDDEVKAEAMAVLRKMYPDIEVPEATGIYFGRWFSDPLYRGSFSNWPPRYVSRLYGEE